MASLTHMRSVAVTRTCCVNHRNVTRRVVALPRATKADFAILEDVLTEYKNAPPSVKYEITADIKSACEQLQANGTLKKWGCEATDLAQRRQISMGELRMMGIKEPEAIAKISVRNDAAFLMTTVGVSSVLAVVLGQLPGDWGFWGSYLTGGISIAVLAIGSTNPGILQFAIDSFSKIFPDYKERVIKHEAAHVLCAHLLGVPVAGYSLMLGKEHTDLAEAALQQRLIEKQLGAEEVDRLSIIAMAGATAEAMNFPDVMGQNADMLDLQRIMWRSSSKMGDAAQQNQTRWAAYQAAALMRKYKNEYNALIDVMTNGGSVNDCIMAIENTATEN